MTTLAMLLAVTGGRSGWLPVICVIIAMVLFGIAAFWQPAVPNWNRIVAAGLFFYTLAGFIVMVGGV